MAITPRCSLTFAASTGATVTPALTGWTSLGGGTAPQSGDFVILITGVANSTPRTFSQTSGTGTWGIQGPDANSTAVMNTAVCTRVFDGTETAPTFTWSNGGRQSWTALAFTPDTGSTLSIDVWATTKIDTTTGTSHTPNSATAAGSGELSIILTAARATANGTTAITFTAPTSWTSQATGSEPGSGSAPSNATNISSQSGVSGTVTPGAVGTNVTTGATLYHVLVKETSPAHHSLIVPNRYQRNTLLRM